jgi:hypothetical protein
LRNVYAMFAYYLRIIYSAFDQMRDFLSDCLSLKLNWWYIMEINIAWKIVSWKRYGVSLSINYTLRVVLTIAMKENIDWYVRTKSSDISSIAKSYNTDKWPPSDFLNDSVVISRLSNTCEAFVPAPRYRTRTQTSLVLAYPKASERQNGLKYSVHWISKCSLAMGNLKWTLKVRISGAMESSVNFACFSATSGITMTFKRNKFV